MWYDTAIIFQALSMFTQKSSDHPLSGSGVTTVIAKGVKIEGEFISQGDVVIDGEVHGVLTAAGSLTVGPEAIIKATVTAAEATIAGRVEGNLMAHKLLEIKSSAQISGDVKAETLSIEAGARLQGQMRIGPPAEQTIVAHEKERGRSSAKAMLAEGAS